MVHSASQNTHREAEGPIVGLPEVVVGLRVRLRKEKGDGYLMPLRRFAETGRIATVTNIGRLTYRVEFDVGRKGAAPVATNPHVGLFWREYEPA